MSSEQFPPQMVAAFDQDMAALNTMLDKCLGVFKAYEVLGGEMFAIARTYADIQGNDEMSRDRVVELFVTTLARLAAVGVTGEAEK